MPAKYDPDKHHRQSIRLKHYDYSAPGSYFITICLQNRACLLGRIVNGQMQLNDAGQMVHNAWEALPQRFPQVALDTFVVMPNHFHGILIFQENVGAPQENVGTPQEDVGAPQENVGAPLVGALNPKLDPDNRAGTRPAPTRDIALGDVVGAFKSITTHAYITGVHNQGWKPFHKRLWQRNYYERIIRDSLALHNIRQYIVNNPQKWHEDQLNSK